jgi:carboxylate-amine ligase
VTRELRSHIQQILEDGKLILKEHVKPEMHQSVVEVGTDICANAAEARAAVKQLRRDLAGLANKSGLCIASAGTHPFSHWMDQQITEGARYAGLVQDMQQIARANLIFGLHVHVGIPDREMAIQVMNMARYFLPHIFALSTNSPYEDYLKLLVKTNCIDNAKKIWWDIRLHPFFDTLEFRMCDAQMRVDDTIALAAVIQAVVSRLHKLMRQNMTFRVYRRRLIDENRWRASRYGIDGKLIDFGQQCETETRSLIHELIEFIAKEVDEFGTANEIAYIESMLKSGTGADRQLEVWQRTNDVKSVVDFIVAETNANLT